MLSGNFRGLFYVLNIHSKCVYAGSSTDAVWSSCSRKVEQINALPPLIGAKLKLTATACACLP
jgi:hypothetical protein